MGASGVDASVGPSATALVDAIEVSVESPLND